MKLASSCLVNGSFTPVAVPSFLGKWFGSMRMASVITQMNNGDAWLEKFDICCDSASLVGVRHHAINLFFGSAAQWSMIKSGLIVRKVLNAGFAGRRQVELNRVDSREGVYMFVVSK